MKKVRGLREMEIWELLDDKRDGGGYCSIERETCFNEDKKCLDYELRGGRKNT